MPCVHRADPEGQAGPPPSPRRRSVPSGRRAPGRLGIAIGIRSVALIVIWAALVPCPGQARASSLLPTATAAVGDPAPGPDAGRGDLPRIDVYTMGPGEELFSRFGHAAICVTDEASRMGRCYNYGTADFSTPGPLTWNFLRGRAMFWVSVAPRPLMEALYRREDRTLYRQRLPLSPEATRRLIATLHEADVRERTFYRYHHFSDNCTTRLRDLIDAATDGALRRDTQALGAQADPPLRRYVHRGFTGETALLTLTDLVLGRAVDRPTTRWQGMFLPDVLRAELQARLNARPEVVYTRQAPLPGELAASPSLADLAAPARGAGWLLVVLGGGLCVLALRLPRLGRVVTGLVLGGLGLLVWGLIAAAALPELRYNEVALVCWPTDLALLWLPPRPAARYLQVRLLALLACALAAAAGLLLQPLGPVLGLCALPLLVQWRAARRVLDERAAVGPAPPHHGSVAADGAAPPGRGGAG